MNGSLISILSKYEPSLLSTYSSFRHEVRNMDELAGMSIDECLKPRASFVVLDLHDVRERERAVLLGDELQGGRPFVELSVQKRLGSDDGVFQGDRGGCRRNRF